MCRKIRFSQPEWRMPAIIEAWFWASEKITQPGSRRAMVESRGLVGDEARGEDERRRLAVQRGELALEQDVEVRRAGDVARAAGAGTHALDRGAGRLEDDGVLAHAEIVVRAPDGDRQRRGLRARIAPGLREGARLARQIAEHPVAPLGPDPRHRGAKSPLVVHHRLLRPQSVRVRAHDYPHGDDSGQPFCYRHRSS